MLPYTQDLTSAKIHAIGDELLQLLHLPGQPVFLTFNAESGLQLEDNFRLNWWQNRDDQMRHLMHQMAADLYKHNDKGGQYSPVLTNAWMSAANVTNSEAWRLYLSSLLAHATPSEKSFIRLFFRFSQQVLSRLARWNSVVGSTDPSPYAYLWELVVAKTLPLGYLDGRLYLFQLNDQAYDGNSFFSNSKSSITERSAIFLCFEFKNFDLAKKICDSLNQSEWTVHFGVVNETIEPIEHQLADKILNSFLLIAVVEEIDPDYGLPIWISQEISFAKATDTPVLLITSAKHNYLPPPGVILMECDVSNLNQLQDKIEEHIRSVRIC